MFNTYIENYDLIEEIIKQSDCLFNRLIFLKKIYKRKQIQYIKRKFFNFSFKKYIKRYCYNFKMKRNYHKMNKISFQTSIVKLLKENKI